MSKYDRKVTLLCPTCGNSDLIIENEVNIVCPNCNRTMTKDELINENSESINAHVDEVKKEIVQELNNQIKNIFKGSKNFRIK